MSSLTSTANDLTQKTWCTKSLKVEKEVQMNVWTTEILTTELHNYGFDKWHSFSSNNFSVFGSSQPDFAFSKHNNGNVVAAVFEMSNVRKD